MAAEVAGAVPSPPGADVHHLRPSGLPRQGVSAAESLTSGISPLTEREHDVLRAATDGGTVADIARPLHLSEGTVRNHLSAAIGKTGARTRAGAVKLAEERCWL